MTMSTLVMAGCGDPPDNQTGIKTRNRDPSSTTTCTDAQREPDSNTVTAKRKATEAHAP